MGVHYDTKTKRYTVRIFRDGAYRVRQRLPAGTTKQQAEAYDAKCRSEIWSADRLDIKPERTIAEAVTKWVKEESCKSKNQSGLLSHAEKIAQFCAGHLLSQMPEAIQSYIELNRSRLSPATINRRISIMRRIANLAYKQWQWIDQPIAHRIRLLPVNNARQVYLTREEILAIVKQCQRRQTRALILVAAWTGLRLGELTSLEATAVTKMIHVRDSKNGKPRVVPLVGYARFAIKDFPLTYHKRTLIRDFEQAREKAEMPHVHFHDLRHSCASMLLAAGVSLEVIGQILGHKSVQTTRRYAHLSTEAMTVALRKIA